MVINNELIKNRLSADADMGYKGKHSETLTSLHTISDSNCTVSNVQLLVCSGVLKQWQ